MTTYGISRSQWDKAFDIFLLFQIVPVQVNSTPSPVPYSVDGSVQQISAMPMSGQLPTRFLIAMIYQSPMRSLIANPALVKQATTFTILPVTLRVIMKTTISRRTPHTMETHTMETHTTAAHTTWPALILTSSWAMIWWTWLILVSRGLRGSWKDCRRQFVNSIKR